VAGYERGDVDVDEDDRRGRGCRRYDDVQVDVGMRQKYQRREWVVHRSRRVSEAVDAEAD